MTNLTTKIKILREEMEEKYMHGDQETALALSCRLDKLIALYQREMISGETLLFSAKDKPEAHQE